jgi:lipopolysaccharide transport system permease protein
VNHHSISLLKWVGTLIRNRNLIKQLVVREFAAKYRGSFLGMGWAILSPLLTALVFVFVFGTVFQSRWGGDSRPEASFTVILLAGIILHGLFSECLARAPSAIVSNPTYVKKVVFPIEILPVVIVLNSLVTATIGTIIVLVLHLFTHGTISFTVLLLPIVFLPFAVMVLGIVYFLCALGVYFRDLMQAIGLVTMASMFISPVLYPTSTVPLAYRSFLYLNPLTLPVEQTRDLALYGFSPNLTGLAVYSLVAILLLWLGFAWFQKTRNGFADVL